MLIALTNFENLNPVNYELGYLPVSILGWFYLPTMFIAVHHPAEEAGEQRHLHALGDRIAGIFGVVHGDNPIRRT